MINNIEKNSSKMSVHVLLLVLIVIMLNSVMSANYEPLFNEKLIEIKAVAGKTAVLPCSALQKGSFKIIWMNPKKILFSQEETIVIDDKRVGVERSEQGDWNLRIKHVQYNDSGEYMCQINTNPIKIKRVRLHVEVPAHILNELSSRDKDVPEGDDVELTCKATGIPTPNITWFRKPIGPSATKEYLKTEGETLYIEDIKRYQSGHYVCLANNGVPPATTREMLVQVQYVPIVKLRNQRLGQSLNKETILECSVTAYPRPKVNWYKNDVVIMHSYKFRQELYTGKQDVYTLTLQILHINRYDYGDYTCEAENRMGTERATMVLYEYKEPTSRTMPTTTYRTITSTNPYYNQGKRTEDYVLQSDSGRHSSGNRYNNNYEQMPDITDYLRNNEFNSGNTFKIDYAVILGMVSCIILYV